MSKAKKMIRIYTSQGLMHIDEDDFHDAVINEFAMGGEHFIKDENGQRYSVIVSTIAKKKSRPR